MTFVQKQRHSEITCKEQERYVPLNLRCKSIFTLFQPFLKEHTHSFFQSTTLLSQFDSVNIGKGGIVAEHLAVDCSYHELLHLPLQNDMKNNNFKATGTFMWCAGQEK